MSRRPGSPGGSTVLDLWSDILGPECWRVLDAEVADCPLRALTQLRLLVWIPVFDFQFILSHWPPSYRLLGIPNVFGFPSSLCSSASFSPSLSIPSPSLIYPSGFITPSFQYEPNLNNVEAPHLIGCLIGQSTRALIKNKQRNNNGGRCCTKMGRKMWAYTYMLVQRIQSNYGIHSACVGMPRQHFHQQHFNYNIHISNCFSDIRGVAIIPYVVMLECQSSLRWRTECAGNALKCNYRLKIISVS